MLRSTKDRKGHEACSGCGVCLLSCPVWHRTRTMSFTRKARAKAVQAGATYEEIGHAIDSCLLCGACEKACPEGIGLFDLNMHQRQELNMQRSLCPDWYPDGKMKTRGNGGSPKTGSLLLAGEMLGRDKRLCDAVTGLLGGTNRTAVALDDGQEIARFMEAGLALDVQRIDSFIRSLQPAGSLIVAEGLLHRPLRKWLPNKKVLGLGEALLATGTLRSHLGAEDLYMIESRGYHADHERLVLFYDRLRRETGCQTNLDLQRTATSTGASSLQGRMDLKATGCIENAKRILKGKRVNRIVVEDLADAEAFRLATDIPVVHLGLLGSEKT
ncbi:MAG: 4Fe-4S dicluster domain-containing protein [Thermodesulfovibrionales bacterium]